MTLTIIFIIGIVLFIYYDRQKINKEVEQKYSLQFSMTNKQSSEVDDDSSNWEVVYRKTARWEELGFGEGLLFPGYGRIYERIFEVWYCDVGSKERKCIQTFKDKYPMNYSPKKSKSITGENVYLERLSNTKGYEVLFSGLDRINRKRWYFAVIDKIPTGIETERAVEPITEVKEFVRKEVEVLDGWELVYNDSARWTELEFDKPNKFPGYGSLYNRTFSVWYCNVNSREKYDVGYYTDISLLRYLPYGIDSFFQSKIGKRLKFETIGEKSNFELLMTGLDSTNRRRYYVRLEKVVPSYIYTSEAFEHI